MTVLCVDVEIEAEGDYGFQKEQTEPINQLN